jgi:hypothetical protein
LEKNATCRFDSQICQNTYALMVFEIGDRQEQLTETEVIWRPLAAPPEDPETRASSSTASKAAAPSPTSPTSSCASSLSSESEGTKAGIKKRKGKNNKKRAAKKAKMAAKRLATQAKAAKRQKDEARKVLACIAAPLKSLATGLNERLCKVTTDMVPMYVRQESQESLSSLQGLDKSWTALVSGDYTSDMGTLDFDKAMKVIKSANEHAKRLDSMLSMAEGFITTEPSSEKDNDEAKKKRKKH